MVGLQCLLMVNSVMEFVIHLVYSSFACYDLIAVPSFIEISRLRYSRSYSTVYHKQL